MMVSHTSTTTTAPHVVDQIEHRLSADDATYAAVADFITEVITTATGRITKDGAHENQGWRFVSYEQIVRVLRPIMSENGMRLVPVDSSTRWETIGKARVCYLTVTYRLITPAGSITLTVCSEGADYSDKAATKAWTYAKKIAYQQLFDVVEDGADPDREDVDLAAAAADAELAAVIERAHALADAHNLDALRGMWRPTAHLHGETVRVAVWWSDRENWTTTLGAYLTALAEHVKTDTTRRESH